VQRHELLATLSELKLRGMAAAFDEAVVQGLRLRRPVEEILGDLLRARQNDGAARSAIGSESFRFDQSPVNAALMRSLHDGTFLAAQRNVVLVGGTGTASWCPSRYHLIKPKRFAADRQTADGAGDEHRRFA
jgi:hypothetical protein